MGDAIATTELFKHLLNLDGLQADNLLTAGLLKSLNTNVNLDIVLPLGRADEAQDAVG